MICYSLIQTGWSFKKAPKHRLYENNWSSLGLGAISLTSLFCERQMLLLSSRIVTAGRPSDPMQAQAESKAVYRTPLGRIQPGVRVPIWFLCDEFS